jgi:hypothetical protein
VAWYESAPGGVLSCDLGVEEGCLRAGSFVGDTEVVFTPGGAEPRPYGEP